MNTRDTLTISPSYADLLTHAGITVLAQETFGQYQGDYLFAVREGDAYGAVIVGYGSCSGCDELEAMLSGNWQWNGWPDNEYRAITQLAADLVKRIHWGDRTELHEDLLGEGSYMRWYRHDEGFEDSMRRILALIPDSE